MMGDEDEYTEEELSDEMELFNLEVDLHRKYVILTNPWWSRRVLRIRLSDALFAALIVLWRLAETIDPED